MIIKETAHKTAGPSAAKALLEYLLSDVKVLGYTNVYPKGVGDDLIIAEANARQDEICYSHIITSVRYDENPTPQFWQQAELDIKSALGLSNHPHVSVTHYETSCHHMHTMIGCVDMFTGRIKKNVWGSHHKLGDVRNNLEKIYKLSNSNPNQKGINNRNLLSLRPKWDEEYQMQKRNVVDTIKSLSVDVVSWSELKEQIEKNHKLILLAENERRELAIFDSINRWIFEGFEELLEEMEANLGKFPFEIVFSVPEFLKDREIVSLRPRATQGGVALVVDDMISAREFIDDSFPQSLFSLSKKGINKYGCSLSVSLRDYALGRAVVYSNGVEPYSESKADIITTNILAQLLLDSGGAERQRATRIEVKLLEEASANNQEIGKRLKM